ncbi:MAG: hypothetical protein JNG86_12750 [Verrucomicrobiaceae bacterium]|nr:hypothetical protein [Verrucomicrobiaceae bacterium]
MGYYIRVLSTSSEPISFATLEGVLKHSGLKGKLSLEAGTDEAWDQIVLSHNDGREIASIERNVVTAGSLAFEELETFKHEIADCKPASSVQWLIEYFSEVRSIYAFQLLSGTDYRNGWKILGIFKNAVWKQAPSIIQADREGFSNEDGYHILWQFNEDVSGKWWMGVLEDGRWVHFQMKLENRKQREAFFAGQVPPGTVPSYTLRH